MKKSILSSLATAVKVKISSLGVKHPEVGMPSPLFEAQSTAGLIRLTDYLGKRHVILAFYYADFTPGWTHEVQVFQNELNSFEILDAQVLGVSPDTLETHYEFAQKFGLTFPLISDSEGRLQRLYASGRVTFIIDKSGIIRGIQKGLPEIKNILKLLEI